MVSQNDPHTVLHPDSSILRYYIMYFINVKKSCLGFSSGPLRINSLLGHMGITMLVSHSASFSVAPDDPSASLSTGINGSDRGRHTAAAGAPGVSASSSSSLKRNSLLASISRTAASVPSVALSDGAADALFRVVLVVLIALLFANTVLLFKVLPVLMYSICRSPSRQSVGSAHMMGT